MPSLNPNDLSKTETTVLYRGQPVTFSAIFLENSVRVAPFDVASFPAFAIYDPTGTAIATGVGTDMGNGNWQVQWNVPAGAKTGDCKITWTMFSVAQRTYQYTERFTLKEQNNNFDVSEDLSEFIFWPNQGDRITLLTEGPKVDVTLQVVMPNGGGGQVLATYDENSVFINGATPDIRFEDVGGKRMYFADLNGYSLGEWLLIWTYKDYVGGRPNRVVKHLYVPGTLFWELHPMIADVVDRIQKNAQMTPFGYFEEDLYRYIKMGFKTLNRFKPLTQWDINDPTYPRGFDHYLIEAAAFWAFKSREVGAGELAFNYSGQEVTLDVDRSAVYNTQVSAMLDDINNFFKPEKVQWYRHTYTPARLGLRLGLGVSAVLGGGDMLGGVTSPYMRGFSRARRKGSW